MSYKKYFGRYYHLRFDVKGTTLDLDSRKSDYPLDIKFDVKYARGQTAREGTVSVLGLHFHDIEVFLRLSAKARGLAMKEMVHVSLEAGYENGAGSVNVFDGFVWYATITAPPTMWVNMKVSEVNPLGAPYIKKPQDQEPKDLYLICEEMLSKFSEIEGVKFRLIDQTEKQILKSEKSKKISYGGTETLTLARWVSIMNQQASDEIQFILNTEYSTGERILTAVDKKDFLGFNREIPVDKDHGLLTVTGIDCVNGCITTFIDKVSDKSGPAHLVLKSELNPQANGKYLILRKQHVGHYEGQEWYTRYTCSDRRT